MEKFYFAQKAFIIHNRKLLLVQKSEDDPYNPGKWEVPGGRMNFGEDVDDHIRREVEEEVGIKIVPGRPFYVWQWQLERTNDNGDKTKMQIVAVARLCSPTSLETSSSHRVEDDFLGEIKWINIKEINNYDMISNMEPVIASFLSLPELRIDVG